MRSGILTTLMRKAAACKLKLREAPPDEHHVGFWSMFAERSQGDADIAIHAPTQAIVEEAMLAALDAYAEHTRRG